MGDHRNFCAGVKDAIILLGYDKSDTLFSERDVREDIIKVADLHNQLKEDINSLLLGPKDFDSFATYYAAYLTESSNWILLVDALRDHY